VHFGPGGNRARREWGEARYAVVMAALSLVNPNGTLVTDRRQFIPQGKISANAIAEDYGSCLIMFA
jgi:hypothetical protein